MKKILLLLALIPNLAFAQGWQIPNPAGTPRALPTPGTVMTKANVDTFGNQQVVSVDGSGSGETQSVIPVSNAVNLNGQLNSVNGYFNVGTDTIEAASTTTVLNLTAHVARVGDIIVPTGGTAANIDVAIPICSVATNSVTLCNALPATPSTDAIQIRRPNPLFTPKEESLHVNGDLGSVILGVRNEDGSTITSTEDGYGPITMDRAGRVMSGLMYLSNIGSGNQAVKLEDSAAATGDALVGVAGYVNANRATQAAEGDYTYPALDSLGGLFIAGGDSGIWKFEDLAVVAGEGVIKSGITTNSALAAASATNGDWTYAKADELGRTITTLAPAGETFQACGTATATTGDVAIKAAVVGNRHYITAVTCKNTSATTATPIDFKDGATTIAVGAVAQTTGASAGAFEAQFPVPLRGTSNTAINFATNVSTSSVTCCASGYISVN